MALLSWSLQRSEKDRRVINFQSLPVIYGIIKESHVHMSAIYEQLLSHLCTHPNYLDGFVTVSVPALYHYEFDLISLGCGLGPGI